jgi:transcription elongation GreA/GreB family factor
MKAKKELLQRFEAIILEMQKVLTQAALAAHAAATHSESKAEDQYDTRGLEASYLAGAQSRRALELEQILNSYRFIDVKSFGPQSPIAATALVELRADNGNCSTYLLMPTGGGMSVDWHGKKVQTITAQSPLGSALVGRKVGDEVSVSVAGIIRDFEIASVE